MDDIQDSPPTRGLSRRTLISTALAAGVSLTVLEAFGISAGDVAQAAGRYGTVQWPCEPHPTPTGLQVYGSPRSYAGGHKGSDYGVSTGTPVVAIASGVVTLSNRNGVEGNYVTILHDNGIKSHCIHFSQRSVRQGERVEVGQQIGLSGEDGSAAEGEHLHIEIYEGGDRYDPDAWLKANVGPGNITPAPTPEEEEMKLITVICDAGPNTEAEYGSTAIVTEATGFRRTSTGLGERGQLQGYINAANILGIPISEKHIDGNGWIFASLLAK
jgi:hypothetical protein